MSVTSHPSWDDLLGHGQRDHKSTDKITAHLAQCNECRRLVAEASQLRSGLRALAGIQRSPSDDGHLTDDDICAYVHERIEEPARQKVESHLHSCGACMKEILRTRAHLNAQKPLTEAVAIPAAAAQQEPSVSVFTLSRFGSLRRRPFSRPTLWTGAFAASIMLCAAAAWLATALWQNDLEVANVSPVPRELAADAIVPGGISSSDTIQQVSQTHDNDGINWYDGYIQTTAVGTADMSRTKNDVQAEIIAETAARHLAYAQLAELIEGVHISENTVYRDLLMETSNLAAETDAFIRDALVVRKKVEWIGGVPRASVTLRAPLNGENSLSAVIERQHDSTGNQNTPSPRSDPHRIIQASRRPLIIDARDVAFVPALQLNVKAGSNALTLAEWSQRQPSRVHIQYQSGYTATDARVIKVNSSPAPGTVMVTPEDAAALRAYLEASREQDPAGVTVVF